MNSQSRHRNSGMLRAWSHLCEINTHSLPFYASKGMNNIFSLSGGKASLHLGVAWTNFCELWPVKLQSQPKAKTCVAEPWNGLYTSTDSLILGTVTQRQANNHFIYPFTRIKWKWTEGKYLFCLCVTVPLQRQLMTRFMSINCFIYIIFFFLSLNFAVRLILSYTCAVQCSTSFILLRKKDWKSTFMYILMLKNEFFIIIFLNVLHQICEMFYCSKCFSCSDN